MNKTGVKQTNPTPKKPPMAAKKVSAREERDQVVEYIRKNSKERDLLDPCAHQWLEQLHDVWTRRGDPVGMPLFEDNFPCPTIVAKAYGSTPITVATGMNQIHLWGFPNGCTSAAGNPGIPILDAAAHSTQFVDAAGQEINLGPLLHPVGNGAASGLVYFQSATAGNVAPVLTLTTALQYDRVDTPFLMTQDGTEFRTSSYGVRVTFIGRLIDTEGYIEFAAPYELPNRNEATTGFRADRSYRREFFGDKRTHEFVWQPNCDDVKFSLDAPAVPEGTGDPSRFFMTIAGLQPGDKFIVETFCVQEFTGRKAIPVQTAKKLTQDATHVVNALVSGHGSVNKPSLGQTRAPRLATLATAHKVNGHPLLRRILTGVGRAGNLALQVGKYAKGGAKVIEEISALFA